MHTHPLNHRPPQRGRQRGAAALALSLILLFGMTVIAFFASRNMIFEQRTSANQYRSTKAFELAEAGMEWAVARLNEEGGIDAAPNCTTLAPTAVSFAERYLPLDATGFPFPGFAAGTTLYRAACRMSSTGAVTCTCPTPTAAPAVAFSADAEPRFVVDFQPGPEPWSARIVSRGCTNVGAFCFDGSGSPDGSAVVSSVYKMRPRFPSAPGAGLITGAQASTGGNLTVINKDPKSNGITINSGSVVNLGGSTSVVTVDGTAPRASVLDNDVSLRNLTNSDATGERFFRSFFNASFSEFQDNPKTWRITAGACGSNTRCTQCASANACGQAVTDAFNNSSSLAERFWSDTDISLNMSNGSTFGSPTRPLSIATTATTEFKGNMTAYGLFYSATASASENTNLTGTANALIYGAIAVRGAFNKGSGTLRLVYDANLFNPTINRDVMVRLPGSWRDTLGEL